MNSSRLLRSSPTAPRATLVLALAGATAANLASAASMPLAAHPDAGASAAKAAAREAYGKLPIAFEANQGQADARVRYFSRGAGYSLFLTPGEAVLSLRGDAPAAPRNGADLRRLQDDGDERNAVLRIGFEGANRNPRMSGAERLASRSNYFTGTTALRDIANFGKVRYEGLYPGVDLVYYGTQGQLEYDFVVAPGHDAAPIALSLTGASGMHVDAQGNLVLATAAGDVVQHAPVAYQLVDGQRRAVAAQYAVLGAHKVGFRLGAYDHAQPLVIDPVLVYSTYHGGAAGDRGIDIAVDASSNAYITGRADSSNFPVLGGVQASWGGASDAFVAKFSPTGTLVYSTFIGGSGTDEGAGIAVDASGNAYITGRTTSLNFPTANAFQGTLGGVQDAFLTKINAAGNGIVYSTYLGGDANPGGSSLTSEFGYGVAVDASGSAYVAGLAVSTNFPTTAGAFQTVGGGATDDAFVTKFTAAGNALVYSTYLGGSQFDEAYALAVDGSGNAYVAGITASTNFPLANAKQSLAGSNNDGFLTKLNATGSALVYSTYIGGFGQDAVYGLAVDSTGSAYIAGVTGSANFPVVNSLQAYNGGASTTSTDAFVAKYGPAGNTQVYSTYLGGSSNETGIGVAIDGNGNAYIVGQTTSTNYPTLAPIQATNNSASGLADAFVTEIGANGSGILYSTYLGGSGDDFGNDIAVNSAGDAFIVGQTSSTNFPTASARQAANGGSSDAFIARITTSNDVQMSISDVRVTEGNSGTTNAVFTVSLSKAATQPVSFTFATGNGTATSGSDYTATTLAGQTIAAGTLTRTIAVPVIGDTIGEPDEVFYGNLSAVSGATLADAQGEATIVNDDSVTPPTLSINDVSIAEGNSGTSTMTFTVSLSPTSPNTVGFDIATADISALAGSDYVASSLAGQTIAAGQSSKTFSVTILGDVAVEANETFAVNLSNATGGAVIGDAQGIGTINNDDTAVVPSLSVADVSITEGNSGTSTMNFVVNLSQATTSAVSFDVFTSNNTAAAGSDYVALNATGQTIPAGQTSKSFSVTINGDTTVEGNETFFFNVSNVANATVADGQAIGTIVNDDSVQLPNLSIADVTVTEGNSGTSLATFTVSLSAPSSGAVTYDIATADNSATAGSDYVANAAAAQTIPAGSTSKTFNVTINGDTTVEPNESFFVNVSGVSGANVADGQAVGTINNDDNSAVIVPAVSIGNWTGAEGNSGNRNATFTVSLSQATTVPVSFDVNTEPGTAAAGADYTDVTIPVNIPAGQTSAQVSVPLLPDTLVEANETFTVELANLVNGTIGDGQGLATIQDDDTASISVAPTTVTEGNSGSTAATFLVTLSMPMTSPVTVNIATSNGTATAGSDYVARSASLVIDAGRTQTSFDVRVNGDTTAEPDETFTVTLSGVAGANNGTLSAVGTIANDDAAALTIGQVQGAAQVSSLDGKDVSVQGVVTATTDTGFFLQSAEGEDDGNAATSDGIFVASAATVSVGDRLQVGGTVGEAVTGEDASQLTLTRIAARKVDVLSRGNALPVAIALDPTRLGAGQAVTALERYEGMRVGVAQLSVVSPVGGTIDAASGNARSNGRFYGVAAGVARPFREPGLSVLDRASRANANPAQFDANPERLMIESLGQRGAKALSADAGDTIRGLVGVLGYGAGAYQLLPDPSAPIRVQSGAAPKAVAARGAGQASIASFDLRQLLDDHRDGNEPVMSATAYATRLAKTANVLCAYAKSPDIVGLAGIENANALRDLAAAANANDGNMLFGNACSGSPAYAAHMVDGAGTKDLGFLVSTAQVRPGVPRVAVQSVQQVGAGATFRNRDGSTEPLTARPALLLVATVNDASGASQTLSVLAAQVDALEGNLSAPGTKGWATQGDYLRARRAAQAGYIAGWVQARQMQEPTGKLVVLGDFNASEFDDGHADLLGLVTGRPAARGKVLSFLGSPVASPLTNMTTRLPKPERYTVTRDGNAQAVDHILVNAAFLQASPAAKVAVARINADFGEDNLGDAGVPMRVSDHDPVVLTFDLR